MQKSIEQKIINSIASRQPKRADVYWFVHIDRTDEPYTMEYSVIELEKDKIMRVEFRLGFRIQTRINLFLRKVVQDMVANKEIDMRSRYESLHKYNIAADVRFVILEKFLSVENEFSLRDGFILNAYFSIKHIAMSENKSFGLDTSDTAIEKIPLVVAPINNINLKKIEPFHH